MWALPILLDVHWLVFQIASSPQCLRPTPLGHHFQRGIAPRDKLPLLRAALRGHCHFCLPLFDYSLWKKEAMEGLWDKELRPLPRSSKELGPPPSNRANMPSLYMVHQPHLTLHGELQSCRTHRCSKTMVLKENQREGRPEGCQCNRYHHEVPKYTCLWLTKKITCTMPVSPGEHKETFSAQYPSPLQKAKARKFPKGWKNKR